METTLRVKELMHNLNKNPNKTSELSEEATDSEEEEKFSASSSQVGKREKLKIKISPSLVSSQWSNTNSATIIPSLTCQVENCRADLKEDKQYYKRHKICEHHAKASFVMISGLPQRFCQQCSRLHVLAKFDDNKRSCRSRLAGHNQRRRSRNHYSSEDSPRQKRVRPQLE